MFRHTKIAGTIGPACESEEAITAMVKAGLSIARLNFSHGTHAWHAALIQRLREIEKKLGGPITIMQDISGPRLRLGELPKAGVMVTPGEQVAFTTTTTIYNNKHIPLTFPGLEESLKPGEHVLIDDGRVEGVVTKVEAGIFYLEIIQGGMLITNKGLNFPDSRLTIPIVSDKDKADLAFGVEHGIDVVALSFVSSSKDILDVRYLLKELTAKRSADAAECPAIIAKIERHEAVEHLKEIVMAADGIMVARGDLGLEVPKEEVPLIQKRIIDAARAAVKPVMVATQLLDSMRENRRPTRAEVSDVANAVIDGADSLLLTNETAAGKNPVLVVKTMADIIMATEKSHYDDVPAPTHERGTNIEEAVTELSRLVAEQVKARLIVAASITGETGRLISHVRPELPIIVATNTERVWRTLNLSWGIKPFQIPECHSIEELVARSMEYVKENHVAKIGDRMIIVAGEPVGQAGNVNLVEVRSIE